MLRTLVLKATLALVGLAWFSVDTSKWVEDNDLWKEDNTKSAKNEITQEVFDGIIQAGIDIYTPIAQQNGETLYVNKKWDDATVNASTTRLFTFAIVNMYGGLARREEVTPEGFALVLCHELGHLYGGTPYIQEANKMSAEGQADYFGAKECLSKLLAKYAAIGTPQVTDYMKEKCGNDEVCQRQLVGAFSLGHLLAVIKEEPIPAFETPDQTIVDTTELSYPKTIQCRLDSYHNGTLKLDRPKCWFKN